MRKLVKLNWEKIDIKLTPYQTRPSGIGKTFGSLRLTNDIKPKNDNK